MNKELFLSYNQEVFPDLIGSSMWADVELARSRTRIVDCARHFFSVHQSLDLFPAWHTLPTLGLIQGFIDKWRIVIHLRLWVLALDPAKTKNKKKSGEYLLRVTPFRINVTHKINWISLFWGLAMSNVFTLQLLRSLGSTSNKCKKTPLTLGCALNRKRCFHSYEPEWTATSCQSSVQQSVVSEGKTQRQQAKAPNGAWSFTHVAERMRCERQPGRVMLYVNKGEERKEAIIM